MPQDRPPSDTMPAREISPAQVCAVILSGGRAERMGGADKGLQPFRGVPLARNALYRLQSQTGGKPGSIGINANRNAEVYQSWGVPVWPDAQSDFPGPLAGFLAGLEHAAGYDYLLTVPCDSPLFPLDLLPRMADQLCTSQADIAVVYSPQAQPDGSMQLRSQPVFCLLPTRLQPSLRDFMARGKRKIEAWTAEHHTVAVKFDRSDDAPLAFANANTLAELNELERS